MSDHTSDTATAHALAMKPARFMSEYWGRKPLLVKGAFTVEQVDLVSPDELAGAALEDDIVSRLVINSPPDDPTAWEAEYGPFSETTFERLPETNWTLLVQEAERWCPQVADLTSPFRFLPNWRFDDVMISYAANGGGVGAHVDRYDVFLIQGRGTRRWRIGDRPIEDPRYLDHDDLKLLDSFDPEFEWLAEPGDLIYLPPMVGHEGTAMSPCMTYSVGFRMPSIHDIVFGYVSDYLEEIAYDALLPIGHPASTSDPGLLDFATRDAVRSVVRALAYDEAAVDDWFGRFITNRRRGDPADEADDSGRDHANATLSIADLTLRIAGGDELIRVQPLELAYLVRADESSVLFASGLRIELESGLSQLAKLVTGTAPLKDTTLSSWLDESNASAGAAIVIRDLIRSGVLRF